MAARTEVPSTYAEMDVSDWIEGSEEPMGKSGKRWLIDHDQQMWLFKPVSESHDADGRELPRGVDWPERIAAQVAKLLRVPAAHVELASRNGVRGIVSARVHPDRDLVHGNELLEPSAPYVVEAIFAALTSRQVQTPPDVVPRLAAAGLFAGYLVLDALIANTDRHSENWAVLVDRTGAPPWHLAPSYDHASCLGFQLTDAEKLDRLTTKDQNRTVTRWVQRGRARPFTGRPGLVELAVEGSRKSGTLAHWQRAIATVTPDALEMAVDRVPDGRMSQVDALDES